jgi:predicted PurR-regulated permease PerM
LKTAFLILIGIVFVCTIVFAIVIWRQTVKFEKKARIAKKQKEEYLLKLEEEQRLNQETLAVSQDEQPQDNSITEDRPD